MFLSRTLFIGQLDRHARVLLRGGQLVLQLQDALTQQTQVTVVFLIAFAELKGQGVFVALQFGDDLLGVVVFALEVLELGLEVNVKMV